MVLVEVHDQPRILLVGVDEQLMQELYDLSLLMLVELKPEMLVMMDVVLLLLDVHHVEQRND